MSGVWDPTAVEHDRVPPLRPPRPDVSYVVCSTPRSGSGVLCRGLASSGLGGIPAEYFNAHQREPLARRWGCGPSPEAYAAALRGHRTDASGTFGVKIHWGQLKDLCAERERTAGPVEPAALLEELFPGAAIVHILRLDLDRQAVSLWRAMDSGVWAERHGAAAAARRGRRPRYSSRGILECRHELLEQEAAWQRCFLRAGIRPVEVVYECLVADHAAEVGRVVRAVAGPVAGATGAVPDPDSRRQADARSEEMVRRFAAARRRRQRPSGVRRAVRALERRLP